MTQRISKLLLPLALLTSITAHARLEYDSSQLMMMNSEKVQDIVKKKLQRAADLQAAQVDDENDEGIAVEPEAIENLKDALRIVLSRPDQRDGLKSTMWSRLRQELLDLNSLDPVLESLTQDAIKGLKNTANSPKVVATYVYVLENLMSEIKPDVATTPIYKKVVESIRDAKIKIPKEVLDKNLLKSMNKPTSPSETAAKILPKK